MNKVMLIGNVTRDPEAVNINGVTKCEFTLAVNRRYAGDDGVKQADYIRCFCWRSTAELVNKYVKKGKKLGVGGEIRTRSYQTQDGSKRFVTEVEAFDVEFLDNKGTSAGEAERQEADPAPEAKPAVMTPADDDDELPF